MFRKFGIYFFAIIGFSFATSDSQANIDVFIKNDSFLTISGTTNINNFECGFNTDELINPIEIKYSKKSNTLLFDKAALDLYNGYFDCGGKAINKDFKSLIKAENHPKITLKLKEIQYGNSKTDAFKATIAIELAGKTQTYQTPVYVKKDGDLCITGNLALNINDFDLKAPKKAFGLIVVNNMIDINFKLFVEEN